MGVELNMINKKIILETEIEDFIENDYPKDNNVAAWIMKLYELEFKLSTIRYYPHLFDKLPDVNLDHVRGKLEHISNIIGKQVVSIIYYIYQSWYNYHNYFNAGQHIISRYAVDHEIKEELSNPLFIEMISKLGRFTQGEYTSTIDNDVDVLYNYAIKDLVIFDYIAQLTIPVSIKNLESDTKQFMYDLQMLLDSSLLENFNKQFSPKLQLEKFLIYVESNSDIPEDILQKQHKLLYRYLRKILEVDTSYMERFLSSYTIDADPQETIIDIEKQIKQQYGILKSIGRISQGNLLMKINMILHNVHYTGSMTTYISKLRHKPWFINEFTNYYPIKLSSEIDKKTIDLLLNTKLDFNQSRQIEPSLNNIQNMFQNKTEQGLYLTEKYSGMSGRYIDQSEFFDFLSALPQPELRQWGKELTKFGLDKHFHILMGI